MAWVFNIITLLASEMGVDIDDKEFINYVCKETDMPIEAYNAIMFLSQL